MIRKQPLDMPGLCFMAAGRLVPMVAAISPAAMRSLNDLPLVLGVIEIGLASASRVGWPCGLASFMAPSIHCTCVRSTPQSCANSPRMKIAAVMV